MLAGGHASIVAHDEILAGPEGHFNDVPGTPVTDVRLRQVDAVDPSLTSGDGNTFSGQPDDSLDVEDMRPCHLDCHDVATPGRAHAVRRAVDEIQFARSIGGKHAAALRANRNEEPFQGDEADRRQYQN